MGGQGPAFSCLHLGCLQVEAEAVGCPCGSRRPSRESGFSDLALDVNGLEGGTLGSLEGPKRLAGQKSDFAVLFRFEEALSAVVADKTGTLIIGLKPELFGHKS